MKKLLQSSQLEDVVLGVEILHKQSTGYIRKVVSDLNHGVLKINESGNYTYSIKISPEMGFDEDIYITKGKYYCSIYDGWIYIDHYKRALQRIKDEETILSVSLQNEGTETAGSS